MFELFELFIKYWSKISGLILVSSLGLAFLIGLVYGIKDWRKNKNVKRVKIAREIQFT